MVRSLATTLLNIKAMSPEAAAEAAVPTTTERKRSLKLDASDGENNVRDEQWCHLRGHEGQFNPPSEWEGGRGEQSSKPQQTNS